MRIFRTLQAVYRDTHLTQKPAVTGKNHAVPGLHRDNLASLTGQFRSRSLSQVTFTHPIAVPLALMVDESGH